MKVNIHLRMLNGDVHNITIKSSENIRDLMNKIQKCTNIPPEQVKLICNGKKLPKIEDKDVNRKLSYFNLKKNYIIHLVLRLGPPWGPFQYRKEDWFGDEKKIVRRSRRLQGLSP